MCCMVVVPSLMAAMGAEVCSLIIESVCTTGCTGRLMYVESAARPWSGR